MPKLIINNHGTPKVIEGIAYRDFLLEPETGKPLLDHQALTTHPEKERIEKLLTDFSPIDVLTLKADSAATMTGTIPDTPEFFEKRNQVQAGFVGLAKLIRDPAIKSLAIRPPEAGTLLAYKITSHDYNFTAEELAELSQPEMLQLLFKNGYHLLTRAIFEILDKDAQQQFIATNTLQDFLIHEYDDLAALKYSEERTRINKDGKEGMSTGYKNDMLELANTYKCQRTAFMLLDDLFPQRERNRQKYGRKFQKIASYTEEHTYHDANLPLITLAEKQEQLHFEYNSKRFCRTWNQYANSPNTDSVNEASLAAFIAKRIAWLGLDKNLYFEINNRKITPIHDALLDATVPNAGEWNQAFWFKAMEKQMKYPLGEDNPDLMPILRKAPYIENYLKEKRMLLDNASPALLMRIAAGVTYDNEHLDPALATLCKEWKISEWGFESGREARLAIPEEDHIPDIGRIEGKEIGHPGFYMVKLQRDDPRILLVGYYAHCCDRLDDSKQRLALAHVTSPDSGCYAIFQKNIPPAQDEIVAKTSVWIGKERGKGLYDICFNSWEHRNASDVPEIETIGKDFLEEAAARCLKEPQISRVTLGTMGNKLDKYGWFMETDVPAEPRDPGTASLDSQKQYLVMSRRMLRNTSSEMGRSSLER